MKIFVDTNIFLDLILKRKDFQSALLILNAIERKLFFGVVLDITILNIDYIANKQIRDLREFLSLVNREFEVIGATNDIIEEALNTKNRDLEDNIQYISAKNSKCSLIITNDKNFYSPAIAMLSSNEFVEKYLNSDTY